MLLAIALSVVFAPSHLPALWRQLPPPQERSAPVLRPETRRAPPPVRPARQRRRIRRQRPQHSQRWRAAMGIVALGLSGSFVPSAPWQRFPYIALGFGLCWLTLLLGGRSGPLFPILLLVVAIRAYGLLGRPGRILAAIAAYGSFLVPLVARFAKLQARTQSAPAELAAAIEPVLYSFALNAALLYAFVLAFVLLLVGALVSERRGQQQLARANQRLRDYARLREERAILQERNRIARELHDSIGHHLIAQSIQLENADLFFDAARDRAASHLEKARQLGKAALADIRNSVATLRSNPAASTLGEPLTTALAALLQDFSDPERCSIVSQIALPREPPPSVAIALYRVAQEALTNAAKHGRASRIAVSLEGGDGNIRLAIADDGCGFEPSENSTGFGLQNMTERVSALGGQLRIVSQPGAGCQILATVPVSPAS